ncbi:MAG: hypothetical protein IIC90_04725, partial [Chloroflexi bacterium]|nr:hypothetical protein [Chloroflexota bacterium]
MHRTRTRLRISFGLVAMMVVLAMVAFMTMVSSNGTTSVSASDPTPTAGGPSDGFKILAKVTKDNLPILTITKKGAQTISVDDNVLWGGDRYRVTARDGTTVTIETQPCNTDDGGSYPPDTDWVYQPNTCPPPPTPTPPPPTPTPSGKPGTDGNLSGVSDLQVTAGNGA